MIARPDELAGPRLRAHFQYRRFADATCRVLLLEPHYHLARECRRALTELGHPVAALPVPAALAPGGTWIKDLLLAAARHQPDFVLSINHMGFDREGALAGVLDALALPTAVWYVDSPAPILGGSPAGSAGAANEHVAVFVWERSHVGALRERGFAQVRHLPLGTDPSRFPPRPHGERRRLAFVGDSTLATRVKWQRGIPARLLPGAEAAARTLCAEPALGHDDILRRAGAADATGEVQAAVLGFVTSAATGLWRHAVLKGLPQDELEVFGDDGWRGLLPGATAHGIADYFDETPAIYATSAVNLNVHSRQMPTAVNQRVFDVPAAGGFLLTDWQADLDDLFSDGGALATYRSPAEAAEKYRFFAERPAERRRVADAARVQVLAAHTYRHRLAELVLAMRQRYA